MLNLNLNEQDAQRTSFDTLDLTGYELSEEQLRFVAGGGHYTRKTSPDGTITECWCDTPNLPKQVGIR